MKPENRTKPKPEEETLDSEKLYNAAQACFGRLSEGFVIAGYCRRTRRKFLWKITQSKVFDDGLQEMREPLMAWYDPQDSQPEQNER
jgi:hypothetical protein